LAMLPEPESEQQRRKLCVEYAERWKSSGEDSFALDDEVRDKLRASQCTCLGK
jgi:hypothetical protein